MAVAEKMAPTFSRPTLSMVWDFTEMNPFCTVTSNFGASVKWVSKVLDVLPASAPGLAFQQDAQSQQISGGKMVSTDPPYYDNIGYADLSDFFYVWLREFLRPDYPELLSTLVVPKQEELVSTPGRHGGRDAAARFFLDGMKQTMGSIASQLAGDTPLTMFYAFKQSEGRSDEGVYSTGWETFLSAVVSSELIVSGTWPMRTERSGGLRTRERSSLASSIVLVCRKRAASASMVTRRDFAGTLRKELPEAIKHLQMGGIAPVDLQQAAIGPGMAIFSRYAKVLEADGSSMPVRMALALINQELDVVLQEQEGEFEPDTRFAVVWFEQHGFKEGDYGTAETLATARAVSVDGVVESGILESAGGKVRLLKIDELADGWSPESDHRLTVWEVTHYLCRALDQGGIEAAADLVHRVGPLAENARDLGYRLYSICDKNKWATEAQPYNALVASWHDIQHAASRVATATPKSEEGMLFET